MTKIKHLEQTLFFGINNTSWQGVLREMDPRKTPEYTTSELVGGAYHAQDFLKASWQKGENGVGSVKIATANLFTENKSDFRDQNTYRENKSMLVERIRGFLNASDLASNLGGISNSENTQYHADALQSLGESIALNYVNPTKFTEKWQSDELMEVLKVELGSERADYVLASGITGIGLRSRSQSFLRDVANGNIQLNYDPSSLTEDGWKKEIYHEEVLADKTSKQVLEKTIIDIRKILPLGYAEELSKNGALSKLKPELIKQATSDVVKRTLLETGAGSNKDKIKFLKELRNVDIGMEIVAGLPAGILSWSFVGLVALGIGPDKIMHSFMSGDTIRNLELANTLMLTGLFGILGTYASTEPFLRPAIEKHREILKLEQQVQ